MQHNETWRGFLQGSGIRYGRDTNRKDNKVLNIEVFDPSRNAWTPLEDGDSYFAIVSNFIADGGDGFTMFKGIPPHPVSDKLAMTVDSAVFQEYVAANTPVR